MKIERLLRENHNLISQIEDEYRPQTDIFSTDSPYMYKLKSIIYDDLTDIERRVLLLFVELGSMRKTARLLNISPSSISTYVHNIKMKIFSKFCCETLDVSHKNENI